MTYYQLAKLPSLTILIECTKLGGADHTPKAQEVITTFGNVHSFFNTWIRQMLSEGATIKLGTRDQSPAITAKSNLIHVGDLLWVVSVKEDPNGVMVKKFLGD